MFSSADGVGSVWKRHECLTSQLSFIYKLWMSLP